MLPEFVLYLIGFAIKTWTVETINSLSPDTNEPIIGEFHIKMKLSGFLLLTTKI